MAEGPVAPAKAISQLPFQLGYPGVDQFSQPSTSVSGSFSNKLPGATLQLPVGSGFATQLGISTTPVTGSYIMTLRTFVTPRLRLTTR